MKSYSQAGEDAWIVENLPLPETGTYVDIGCGHPFEFGSNTAFLRDRGWHGVNVDGDPRYIKDWKDIKDPFVCAVISPYPTVTFYFHPNEPYLSRVSKHGKEKAAMRLETLLYANDIQKIDFLSIDVEGHEYDLLKSLDFGKHDPTIIIVEYNTRDIGEDDRIKPFLESKGYTMRYKTTPNMIFTK